jgi:predicted alpha/beta superfamily hydrolase
VWIFPFNIYIKESDNTGIMGSSMGGVISLYAGLKYSDVFSRIGAVSGTAQV